MGDLRNKARKDAERAAIEDYHLRRSEGWTIFHFDFDPKLTRRDMWLGEALRHLLRCTGTRIGWWRCPVRGLAIRYRRLPTTTLSYDHGESYMVLHFSTLKDPVAAKKELATDMLLMGIGLYRGLPNKVFDHQVRVIKELLQAPPSIDAEQWNAMTRQVHDKSRPLLHTHAAELWWHLLGRRFADLPTGTVALNMTPPMQPPTGTG